MRWFSKIYYISLSFPTFQLLGQREFKFFFNHKKVNSKLMIVLHRLTHFKLWNYIKAKQYLSKIIYHNVNKQIYLTVKVKQT